jgi:hypothetical protein
MDQQPATRKGETNDQRHGKGSWAKEAKGAMAWTDEQQHG